MKNYREIAISIFLLLVIAGIALYMSTSQLNSTDKVPLQSQTPFEATSTMNVVATPTTGQENWTTYQNEKYRYRLRYPASWDAIEAHPRGVSEGGWSGDFLVENELQKITFSETDSSDWPGSFQVKMLPNPDHLGMKEWYEHRSDQYLSETGCSDSGEEPCLSYDDLLRGEEYLTIQGLPAYKSRSFGFDHMDICISIARDVYIQSLCYEDTPGNDSNNAEHLAIYNKMVESLQFVTP